MAGLAAGCSQPSTEDYVQGLEALARAAERNRNHCEGFGRAVKDIMKSSRGASLKHYADHYSRLNRSQREAVEQPRYKRRIKAATVELVPVLQRCVEVSTVREAFALLDV